MIFGGRMSAKRISTAVFRLREIGITLGLGHDLRVGAIHEGRACRFEQPGQRQPMGCG